jgi:hypothetical protein
VSLFYCYKHHPSAADWQINAHPNALQRYIFLSINKQNNHKKNQPDIHPADL